MKEYAGIWIDGTKAVIVSVLGEEKTVTVLKSGLTGMVPPEALQPFFDRVLAASEDACRCIVMGPDGTTAAFSADLQARNRELAVKIAAVVPAATLSDAEIESRVRLFFAAELQ